MKRVKLSTSNGKKLAEFRRLGVDVEMGGPGPDLPEVLGSPVEVAMRKALSAGDGFLVEDTSLEVEGSEVGVEVRWLMDSISELGGRRAVFRVLLALNEGGLVSVYEGVQEGALDGSKRAPEGAFGFDPWFVPDGSSGQSLAELESQGKKDLFSARAKACQALARGDAKEVFEVSKIPAWTGGWQSDRGMRR